MSAKIVEQKIPSQNQSPLNTAPKKITKNYSKISNNIPPQ